MGKPWRWTECGSLLFAERSYLSPPLHGSFLMLPLVYSSLPQVNVFAVSLAFSASLSADFHFLFIITFSPRPQNPNSRTCLAVKKPSWTSSSSETDIPPHSFPSQPDSQKVVLIRGPLLFTMLALTPCPLVAGFIPRTQLTAALWDHDVLLIPVPAETQHSLAWSCLSECSVWHHCHVFLLQSLETLTYGAFHCFMVCLVFLINLCFFLCFAHP